ncbi:MAG: 1-acyl-sn-glycerol-3-phosphate acyltransferase, partial [Planctomycetota bacterium]
LSRHTSLIDTLLPVVLLDGWRLRYVLKRELLWDPCLDVVGHRLPNAFVARGGADTSREIRKLEQLALRLGDGEGAVIFPEGTRFTPAKRGRIIGSLRKGGDPLAVSQARKLLRLLPPRWAGSHALLSAAPQADVLVLGHTGLEQAQTLASLLRGDLIGQEVRVRLRRFPADSVPRDAQAFETWLNETWEELDRWLDPADRPDAWAPGARRSE